MKKYNFIILAALLLGTLSCTDGFEELNTDPNRSVDVPVGYIFADLTYRIILDDYQRKYDLHDNLYAQYFATTQASFLTSRYEVNDDWNRRQWFGFYTKDLMDYKYIMAKTEGDATFVQVRAIAEILICYEWARLTDKYGDLPYFEAGNAYQPKYDAQSLIYPDLVNRLKSAVSDLEAEHEVTQIEYGLSDMLYNGAVDKWMKFGNSLQLRLGMRMSEVDPSTAQQVVSAAITAGVMDSNDDVAKIDLDKEYRSGDYIEMMSVRWNDSRVSLTYTNYMNSQVVGTVDPRAPLMFTRAADSTFTGLANGYISPRTSAPNWLTLTTLNTTADAFMDFRIPGLVEGEIDYTNTTLSAPIMYYCEVLFLQAEAALRGWVTGDANQLYKDAVKASMTYVGVDATVADAYIAQLPTISSIADLEQLMVQKWLANFPIGIEAWADYRRTDLPTLMPLADGVSDNALVAPGSTIKRLRYPNNEHDINANNMPAALNTYDADRMDVNLWWDVQ